MVYQKYTDFYGKIEMPYTHHAAHGNYIGISKVYYISPNTLANSAVREPAVKSANNV